MKNETSPPGRPQAVPELQVDNARVRVTRWSFAPGAETGWHRHAMDYVVVPVADGVLLIESAAGRQRFELATGKSYARPAGVEHNVVNDSGHAIAFVEIELKPE